MNKESLTRLEVFALSGTVNKESPLFDLATDVAKLLTEHYGLIADFQKIDDKFSEVVSETEKLKKQLETAERTFADYIAKTQSILSKAVSGDL